MGFCVCGGAVLSCSFGMAPSVLNVLPANKVVSAMPIATIMDNKPIVNILPFGQSDGGSGHCGGSGGVDAHALSAGDIGAVGTGKPYNPGGQLSGFE